jgi:hypothetical protein
LSGYLDRLVARASAPIPVIPPAPLHDPFAIEEQIEPLGPRPAPPPQITQETLSPPPRMKGVRIRSGELRADAPLPAPPKIVPPSADRLETPIAAARQEEEAKPNPVKVVLPTEESAPRPGVLRRSETPEADLQAAADRFMAQITGRKIAAAPERPVARIERKVDERVVETIRPRESKASPAPRPAPVPEPAPSAPLIGNLTVEVLPPPAPPAVAPRPVRTIVNSRSQGFPSGLRSASRFGLGQL